jgi:gliding motility-associated-like protein
LKRILFIFAGLLTWLLAVLPQNVEMPGVVNHYLQVKNVLADRVLVTSSSELSYFHPGDKVLLIQMTGATMPTIPGFETNRNRYKDEWRNAGMYEILQVDQVITGANNYIVFTDNHLNAYDNGERIQLVRLVEGDNVTVTANVSAKPWDGTTGGILAIIGMDSVKLDANLDAAGLGFRGAIVPVENYTGGCRTNAFSKPGYEILDTLHFAKNKLNRSGNKGEGIITADTILWPYTKGAGSAVNGGGAGNGLFSGGGGGGNYWQGGDGGRQSIICTNDTLVRAWGGLASNKLYSDSGGVIMGGGGGSGVQNLLTSNTSTNGGNGGGIIFIITGTLAGKSGKIITANGQSVTAPATGSGGGGGAAGTVILDATNYIGSFSVKIRGGNGGPGNPTTCTGSGGGGSGGVLWHSGNNITGATVSVDSAGGATTLACLSHLGDYGYHGVKLKNLMLNLTGFLFNSIRGIDTICAGQIPNKIKGSHPKGGDGTYTWQWEQSLDSLNWVPAIGTSYRDSIRPPALTQTTFYRRIVRSLDKNLDPITDISRVLKIYVYPVITNNIISGTDTICYNLPAKTLTGTTPVGGNNVYNYQWQFSEDQSTWNNGGTLDSLSPGPLQQSLYFRRQVTSTAYCAHTSNSVKITVLPSITNNAFASADSVICKDLGPGPLNALSPANGDGAYAYSWQSRSTSGSWTSVPSSNVLRFDPGILTDTMLYRRIVYSGNGQACKDTSSTKTIHVLPLITSNIPTIDSSRYCAGDIPELITGSQPQGGNLAYSHQWIIDTSGTWKTIAGATLKDFTPDKAVNTTTKFSRIVVSGTYNACVDTSAALVLDVVPSIQNSIALTDQTICENSTPLALSGTSATGGLGGFTYQWLEKKEGLPDWSPATGINDQESFGPGPLTVTTLFSRKVTSDICSDTTSALTITVYPSISNNNISGGAIQYTCFKKSRLLTGSQPANGSGSYAYEWQQSINNTDWTPANGSTLNFNTPELTTPLYYRRVVFSSPVIHECADTSSSVEVQINPLPTGDLIGGRDTICAGETLYVKFTVGGAHPPFSVTIGDQIKNNIAASLDSIMLTPSSTQSYTLQSIVDDSICAADNSLFTEQLNAKVYEMPIADAGSNDEVCSNTYSLKAVKDIADSKGMWSASGATFADPTDPGTVTTVDQYGSSLFTWTEYNWHCTDDDQVTVIFNEQPAAADAGPDQTLEFKYTTQLEAGIPPVGSGKWTVVSGAGNFDNDTLPDAIIVELDNSTTLKWTVHNGNCPEVSDQVTILIDPLIIPKGFSPNGDTKNDVFDLGAVNAERIRIKIYNSTGVLVFESDDYLEGSLWDGKNKNGVELPEGTYFYIADVKVAGREKEFQFRSFVEILR